MKSIYTKIYFYKKVEIYTCREIFFCVDEPLSDKKEEISCFPFLFFFSLVDSSMKIAMPEKLK